MSDVEIIDSEEPEGAMITNPPGMEFGPGVPYEESGNNKADTTVIDNLVAEISDLSWGGGANPPIFYPFEPSPLYLNNSTVFQKPSAVAMMEGVVYPANYDPLRPRIGHWRRHAGEKLIPPFLNSALWWDTTNNVAGSAPAAENFDFGSRWHRRFIRPALKLYHKIPNSNSSNIGSNNATFADNSYNPAPTLDNNLIDETEMHYNFRFLATNTVTVDATDPSFYWEDAYVYYTNQFDNSSDSVDVLKEKLWAALNAGPLPHSHEGLIDKNGVGFTVSMHIVPKYQKLWKALQMLGSDAVQRAVPTYHTHVLGSAAQYAVGSMKNVDNYDHKNYDEKYGDPDVYPLKHTGIFEKHPYADFDLVYGAHSPEYQIGWKMDHWKWIETAPKITGQKWVTVVEDKNNNGVIDEGEVTGYWEKTVEEQGYNFFMGSTFDEGAVTSPIFLEFMQLYFNNEELHDIIRLVEEDVEEGNLSSADEKPDDPYFISEHASPIDANPSEDVIQQEADVRKKYRYKLKKLKQHLIDAYLSKMQHTPSYSYKTLSAHKVFQDKVFEPKTLVLNNNKGSREAIFNYTKPYYEKATSFLTQHRIIPNPYLTGQLAEDPVRFGFPGEGTVSGIWSPEYQSILGLGNAEFLKDISTDKIGSNINVYLRRWSKIMIDKLGQYDIAGINQNAVMGFPNYDFIKKYNPIPYLYPWYAKLLINTPSPLIGDSSWYPDKRGTFISDIFANTKDELMLFFMARIADKDSSTSTSVGAQYYEQDFYVRDVTSFKTGQTSLEEKKVETFNFTDWIAGEAGLWAFDEFNTKTDNLISFDLGLEEKVNQTTRDNIENAFIEFKDKLEEFHNTRSAYEILDASNAFGEKKYGYEMHPFAHNEIMFYEIEKYSTDFLMPDKLVQRYFIAPPNEQEENVIEFIDSQMKIETGYHYKVNVYVLVIGNKYQYVDIQTKGLVLTQKSSGEQETYSEGNRGIAPEYDRDNDRPGASERMAGIREIRYEELKYYIEPVESKNKFHPIADIFVVNKPNIELLKIPYTSFQTVYVANKPPLHPNVVVYPYKNVNNKLLFTLSQFVGLRTEKPIEILPTDKDKFIKAAVAQKKIDADDFELPNSLEFRSDEPDIRYQVFRIEEHPTAWSDFAMGVHEPMYDTEKGTYRQLIEYENDFVDNVTPNKKYYYIFRSVDSRGYISNPSPIYQVELIDDSGAVYLAVKIVQFKTKIPKKATKSARKYVHIFPTLKQSNIKAPNLESIFSGENVMETAQLGDLFGNTTHPRRFKIRFTSKSSGRKFDLNLNFIHSQTQLDVGKFLETEHNPSKGNSKPGNTVQVTKDTDIPESVKAQALGGAPTLDDLY